MPNDDDSRIVHKPLSRLGKLPEAAFEAGACIWLKANRDSARYRAGKGGHAALHVNALIQYFIVRHDDLLVRACRAASDLNVSLTLGDQTKQFIEP